MGLKDRLKNCYSRTIQCGVDLISVQKRVLEGKWRRLYEVCRMAGYTSVLAGYTSVLAFRFDDCIDCI